MDYDDNFGADWDGLHDHLRDVPCEDFFKFGASTAASEFCDWVQVVTDVYIPHSKYKVKAHSSPWFSAATIIHRNHFFRLYQQNKSSETKEKLRQASSPCKRLLEATKLTYAKKTKEAISSRGFYPSTFVYSRFFPKIEFFYCLLSQ